MTKDDVWGKLREALEALDLDRIDKIIADWEWGVGPAHVDFRKHPDTNEHRLVIQTWNEE